MNRVKIVLSGKEFALQTPESASYVTSLAKTLESKADEFLNANDTASVTAAYMLVGLSLLDDCMKAESDKDNLRKQVIDYLEEATSSRDEITKLKREIEELKEKNEIMSLKLMALNDLNKEEQDEEQTHL